MGIFSNPLAYVGGGPNITGTPSTQNSTVRAATVAEANAGILNDVYISPLTQQAATSLDFASPPVLGFGSTTARPVHATTLNSVGTTTLNTSGAATTSIGTGGTGAVNIGNATGGTAVTGPVTMSGNETFGSALVGVITVPATSGGASPQTTNGRTFAVTFSGVSIAGGATQTFVIMNSVIIGSATQVQYTMSGATSGAALCIQNITNGTGSSTIIVQNGTGADPSTANITFVGTVLN